MRPIDSKGVRLTITGSIKKKGTIASSTHFWTVSKRARPGLEPGISHSPGENRTARPTSH